MESYNVCPTTEEEWKIQDRRVVTGGIHDFAHSLTPKSKFGLRQFLALKTIWREGSADELLSDAWLARLGGDMNYISDLRTYLHHDQAFKIYLTNLDSPVRRNRGVAGLRAELGPFASVLQTQRIVSQLTESWDDEPKLTGLSGLQPRAGRAQTNIQSSSTASSSIMNSLAQAGSSVESADSMAVPTEDHALLDSPHARRVEEASTACEQVVKNAALSYLQGMFATSLAKSYWSAQPKKLRFGRSRLQASVDGHLQLLDSSKSAALLNVSAHKRRSRERGDFRTEWLESAQMALWIEQEPRSFWKSGPYATVCR